MLSESLFLEAEEVSVLEPVLSLLSFFLEAVAEEAEEEACDEFTSRSSFFETLLSMLDESEEPKETEDELPFFLQATVQKRKETDKNTARIERMGFIKNSLT